MQPAPKRQLKLEIPANPTATYANMVMITHNQHEVLFDFIQVVPNDPRARVQQRILMTPAHAKMFLQALTENMERYEAAHGTVAVPPRPESLADQLFKSVPAPPEGGPRPGETDEQE
ncbi:MAG: DUF3467 domain-containing protein [Anaerolineae bacterium]|nr:DUF3467 domain-containing protein [Anaerolineae bacterium]